MEIARTLRQQEDHLVRARLPVGDALQHGVGLVLYDLGAQISAVGLQRHGHARQHKHDVLGLEAGEVKLAQRRACIACLFRAVAIVVVAPSTGVSIAII